MLELFREARRLEAIFDKHQWKYCFIGGVAVQKWGQARVTEDIDLTIFTGFGNEESYIDVLLSYFDARISDARKFAIYNRVLLLVTKKMIEIDISLGAFPYEQSAIDRATKVQVTKGIGLKLCTAEDLIIYKAFADRPRDWLDIEGVIAKQTRDKLDWEYVFGHLRTLAALKEEPEIIGKLTDLIDSF